MDTKNAPDYYGNIVSVDRDEAAEIIEYLLRQANRKSIDEIYENLANAIILQAIMDYRIIKRKRTKNTLFDFNNKKEKEEIKQFFRSDWFTALTEIDPERLINRLDNEVCMWRTMRT